MDRTAGAYLKLNKPPFGVLVAIFEDPTPALVMAPTPAAILAPHRGIDLRWRCSYGRCYRRPYNRGVEADWNGIGLRSVA